MKKERGQVTTEPSLRNKQRGATIDDWGRRIKEHNERVRRIGRNRACYRSGCANCKKTDFAPHDLRRRELRWMAGNQVASEVIWLARWRCRECGRSFTDYPDFRPAV